MEEDLIDTLILEHIADNRFHASNMLNVLHCENLKTDAEKIERCRLYKAWKQAGENKQVARLNAIVGKPPPEQMKGME